MFVVIAAFKFFHRLSDCRLLCALNLCRFMPLRVPVALCQWGLSNLLRLPSQYFTFQLARARFSRFIFEFNALNFVKRRFSLLNKNKLQTEFRLLPFQASDQVQGKMNSIEKLCRLCAEDLDVSVSMEDFGDLTEIQKLINFVSGASFCCKHKSILAEFIEHFSKSRKVHQFARIAFRSSTRFKGFRSDAARFSSSYSTYSVWQIQSKISMEPGRSLGYLTMRKLTDRPTRLIFN